MSRRRQDGTVGYTAVIRLKRGGKVILTETQTFDRKPAATAWMKKREAELAQPGALDRLAADDPLLADVIDRYINESKKAIGRTKQQVLGAIKRHDIASLKCSQISSDEVSNFAQELIQKVEPQTVGNYMSHLGAVFAVAKPLWKYPLDRQAMKDATTALKRMGVIGRSKQRERRPTLSELETLMHHFGAVRSRRRDSIPMQAIIAFAIFSTRRQEEIINILWLDLDEANVRIMVRDMKNPGEKVGNNVWCDLTPEALDIIHAQPQVDDRIFPFSTDAISAAFTRACQFLAIEDLHFHDLRHDGVSRLFELGWSIPRVATVSGHRSWQSLKRYTHIRQSGDKYAGWPWIATLTLKKPTPRLPLAPTPTRSSEPV